jgi:hypothetical protein
MRRRKRGRSSGMRSESRRSSGRKRSMTRKQWMGTKTDEETATRMSTTKVWKGTRRKMRMHTGGKRVQFGQGKSWTRHRPLSLKRSK